MKQKVIIIMLAGFIIRFLSSCEGWCDHVKYYNFTQIELISENQYITKNDSLKLNVRQLDNEFLACKTENLINSAYAFDCDKGWGGMKYSITKIEFTSDADFNADYPANSILNDLITINAWIEPNEYQYIKLNEANLTESLWSDMYIVSSPNIEKKHILTVKIYRENGDTLIANSEEIIWE